MAAMVPVRTSPEPAVAIPLLPLRLMKTRPSGRPTRLWAPLNTITAPQVGGGLPKDSGPGPPGDRVRISR